MKDAEIWIENIYIVGDNNLKNQGLFYEQTKLVPLDGRIGIHGDTHFIVSPG